MRCASRQHFIVTVIMTVRTCRMKQTVQQLPVRITSSFVHGMDRLAHQNASQKHNCAMESETVSTEVMRKQHAVSGCHTM